MEKRDPNPDSSSDRPSNGQLASPALTPVLEHTSLPKRRPKHSHPESSHRVYEENSSLQRAHLDVNKSLIQNRGRSQSSPFEAHENQVLPTSENDGGLGNGNLTTPTTQADKVEVLKLSAAQLQELTSQPDSIPIRQGSPHGDSATNGTRTPPEAHYFQNSHLNGQKGVNARSTSRNSETPLEERVQNSLQRSMSRETNTHNSTPVSTDYARRIKSDRRDSYGGSRVVSTPTSAKDIQQQPSRSAQGSNQRRETLSGYKERRDSSSNLRSPDANNSATAPDGLKALEENMRASAARAESHRSPIGLPTPTNIPLPPFSMPTHLHLELSSNRPSPLYLHRSHSYDYPYEPTRVKFERLLNFLLLPPQLERILLFGALTCLDAWLYTFTILPLRFVKALWILLKWIAVVAHGEWQNLSQFVYRGVGRIWHRYRKREATPDPSPITPSPASASTEVSSGTSRHRKSSNTSLDTGLQIHNAVPGRPRSNSALQSSTRRNKPSVSHLLPSHKADIIQGVLIIASCSILMRFDASRMYHSVRGQAAIKLYVIYNVLEVFDRLFSALGQDIIECLFSNETLERKSNGRSKVIRPFWMFLLALAYTVVHSTALLYQVITLNVAVNSYSNALLTLLMSNQFVEIKGTVFKKFEKENLFQLTCADVVERFQLWLMLLIIALRNVVELGGLSMPSSSGNDFFSPSSSSPSGSILGSNMTGSEGAGGAASASARMRTFSIIPHSFTILPSILPVAQVLMPFLLVLGSEMLVDWVKHAYITKFNATKPAIYARFLDVLAKDYYSNAFGPQNLVRRLGLPVIPLACLFIRAALQTYHMFLATTMAAAPVLSSATSLVLEPSDATSSPSLAQIDHIFRSALWRSSFGGGGATASAAGGGPSYYYPFPLSLVQDWTVDDVIALSTMLVFFAVVYMVLLACKLSLGMVLLRFARARYQGMKARQEQERAGAFVERESKRFGGWGTIEVGEERRRVIYEGDEAGLKKLEQREERGRQPERPSASVSVPGAGMGAGAGHATATAPGPGPNQGPGGGGASRDTGGASGMGTTGLEAVDRYRMVAKRIW